MANGYRNALVQQIKDAGQELINRAESMVHPDRKENPMSQKYDEYLEKHRQAVKKAYQWIAAYIPELTDVEATRNIEFHDMSKNTPDEYTPYDNYFLWGANPSNHRGV